MLLNISKDQATVVIAEESWRIPGMDGMPSALCSTGRGGMLTPRAVPCSRCPMNARFLTPFFLQLAGKFLLFLKPPDNTLLGLPG